MSQTVLVVDDETDYVATYARLLRRAGYGVRTAVSRAEALTVLDRERPGLVISDLRLPDGDGLDVVRAARAGLAPPPVVVVTGYPSEEGRQAALAAGATVFLAKPFAAAQFLAAVRQVLGAA